MNLANLTILMIVSLIPLVGRCQQSSETSANDSAPRSPEDLVKGWIQWNQQVLRHFDAKIMEVEYSGGMFDGGKLLGKGMNRGDLIYGEQLFVPGVGKPNDYGGMAGGMKTVHLINSQYRATIGRVKDGWVGQELEKIESVPASGSTLGDLVFVPGIADMETGIDNLQIKLVSETPDSVVCDITPHTTIQQFYVGIPFEIASARVTFTRANEWLPVRLDLKLVPASNPNGVTPFVKLEDWQEVEGLRIPHRMTMVFNEDQWNDQPIYLMKISGLSSNPPSDLKQQCHLTHYGLPEPGFYRPDRTWAWITGGAVGALLIGVSFFLKRRMSKDK